MDVGLCDSSYACRLLPLASHPVVGSRASSSVFALRRLLPMLILVAALCCDALAALVKMCVNIFCSENHLGVIALSI